MMKTNLFVQRFMQLFNYSLTLLLDYLSLRNIIVRQLRFIPRTRTPPQSHIVRCRQHGRSIWHRFNSTDLAGDNQHHRRRRRLEVVEGIIKQLCNC